MLGRLGTRLHFPHYGEQQSGTETTHPGAVSQGIYTWDHCVIDTSST